jgi:hypothetical protein
MAEVIAAQSRSVWRVFGSAAIAGRVNFGKPVEVLQPSFP